MYVLWIGYGQELESLCVNRKQRLVGWHLAILFVDNFRNSYLEVHSKFQHRLKNESVLQLILSCSELINPFLSLPPILWPTVI